MAVYGDVLEELDMILEKRASSLGTDNKENAMDAKATEGAGSPNPADKGKQVEDHENPQIEQTDDGDRSVKYQGGPQAEGKDDAKKEDAVAWDSVDKKKTAALADRILARISGQVQEEDMTEKEAGAKMAEEVLQDLIKAAQEAEEDEVCEVCGEVECTCPAEDSEEEKAAEYYLSKLAGEKAAEEFLRRVGHQENLQKQAVYQQQVAQQQQQQQYAQRYHMDKQAGAVAAEQAIYSVLQEVEKKKRHLT